MKDFIDFVLQYKIDFVLCAVFVILDFVTGITFAVIEGRYSSHKCRKGFEKIIGYLIVKICLIFICFILPQIKAFFHVFCIAVMFIEFTSIVENVRPYLPDKVNKILEKLLDNIKNNESESDSLE